MTNPVETKDAANITISGPSGVLEFVAGRSSINTHQNLILQGGTLRCSNTTAFGCLTTFSVIQFRVLVTSPSTVIGVGAAFANPKPFGFSGS